MNIEYTWSCPPCEETDSVWMMVMVTAKMLIITRTGFQKPSISLARDIFFHFLHKL